MITKPIGQSTQIADFFDQVRFAIAAFASRNELSEKRFTFEDLGSLKCIYGSSDLEERLTRAISHLDGDRDPNVQQTTIYHLDELTAGFKLPEAPWGSGDFGVQGVIADSHLTKQKVVWQFGSEVLYLYDYNAEWGLFWTYDARRLPHWELSFPLRYWIDWCFGERDSLLVHAGAVGNESGAVLILGKSGSGKSTTSLSCLVEGMNFFGDDYVLVSLGTHPAKVHTLFNSVKLDHRKIEQLKLNQLDLNPLGVTDDDAKKVAYLAKKFSGQFKRNAPLKALLYPQVSEDAQPSIEPMGSLEMLRQSAPSTLFQLPCDRNMVFNQMARLVKQLPCYRIRLSQDLRSNAKLINQFIRNQ